MIKPEGRLNEKTVCGTSKKKKMVNMKNKNATTMLLIQIQQKA